MNIFATIIKGLAMREIKKKATEVISKELPAVLESPKDTHSKTNVTNEVVKRAMEKPFYLSKKFWASAVAVCVPIINKVFGLGLDVDEITVTLVPLIVYIASQGLADFGKNS